MQILSPIPKQTPVPLGKINSIENEKVIHSFTELTRQFKFEYSSVLSN